MEDAFEEDYKGTIDLTGNLLKGNAWEPLWNRIYEGAIITGIEPEPVDDTSDTSDDASSDNSEEETDESTVS